MDVIFEFTYEWGFLSNFHSSEVVLDGLIFTSVEHGYQAAKTLDQDKKLEIQRAPKPGDAKRLGRAVPLRPDWDDVKEQVMLGLLRQKFSDDPLRSRLLATGDAVLIEGNTWGDRYWGVSGGQGLNRLGLMLMAVRQELADASVR